MGKPNFPPMPPPSRATMAGLLRELIADMEAGKISTLLIATITTAGEFGSGHVAPFATDVGQMLRALILNHFSCECGEVDCTTDITRTMLLAVLEPYIAGTDVQAKGN